MSAWKNLRKYVKQVDKNEYWNKRINDASFFQYCNEGRCMMCRGDFDLAYKIDRKELCKSCGKPEKIIQINNRQVKNKRGEYFLSVCNKCGKSDYNYWIGSACCKNYYLHST